MSLWGKRRRRGGEKERRRGGGGEEEERRGGGEEEEEERRRGVINWHTGSANGDLHPPNMGCALRCLCRAKMEFQPGRKISTAPGILSVLK